MAVQMKNKVLLVGLGVGILTIVCVVLYFVSDHHAYNAAVKRYRQKEYKAALSILDRLAPKYQHSSRGIYLRSICHYNLALESYRFKQYDQALKYLNSIPESFMEYDDVEELRDKVDQKKREIEEELVRRRQIAEAKELERKKKEQGKERRRAEEQRLYGADLNARVNYSGGQIHVTNLNSYDWTHVEFQINPGIIRRGYFLKVERIQVGHSYSVDVIQFANKKGERFNPFGMKLRTFVIIAHKPNGSSDAQSYELK